MNNKNIEEQIKEILQKLHVDDSGEIAYKGVWIGFIDCTLEQDLTNLLTQQREEAVRGFAEAIRFDFSQVGLTVRPKWTDPRSYQLCTCGQILQTVGESRQHWQDGHFDEVTTEFADRILNENLKTYLSQQREKQEGDK